MWKRKVVAPNALSLCKEEFEEDLLDFAEEVLPSSKKQSQDDETKDCN